MVEVHKLYFSNELVSHNVVLKVQTVDSSKEIVIKKLTDCNSCLKIDPKRLLHCCYQCVRKERNEKTTIFDIILVVDL